jgi:hypothetical protein
MVYDIKLVGGKRPLALDIRERMIEKPKIRRESFLS